MRFSKRGVNSPVRAFGSVGGIPRFIESARGARIRDIDGNDKRAKKIRLTDRGLELVRDTNDVVAEIRAQYASKIGSDDLDELERRLANCMRKIDLDYLPDSWLDPSRAA